MTERETQVFEYLREYIAENGWAPTYQEIADGVGLKSKADIGTYLLSLEQKGLIKKGNGPRMIALSGHATKEAPCVSKSTPSSCRVRRNSRP